MPTFTCGTITFNSTDPQTLLLTTNMTFQDSASCTIKTQNGTWLWNVTVDTGGYLIPVDYGIWTPINAAISGVQGISIVQFSNLPSFQDLLFTDRPQFVYMKYVSLTAIPSGLSINPKNGTISGVPTATFVGNVEFAIESSVSKAQSAVIGTIFFNIAAPRAPTVVNPAAYSVPIGVGLLAALLLWFYFRHDRRKLFHIFISYRVATDASLAETLCFKLQQKFLSTGHRVRFEVEAIMKNSPLF